MISKVTKDTFDGTWGVVIVQDPLLISNTVHWIIPNVKNADGVSDIGQIK